MSEGNKLGLKRKIDQVAEEEEEEEEGGGGGGGEETKSEWRKIQNEIGNLKWGSDVKASAVQMEQILIRKKSAIPSSSYKVMSTRYSFSLHFWKFVLSNYLCLL